MNIQMSVKLTGSAAVLMSAVVWSIGRVRVERRKTDELAAFCDFVGYIGENIAHFSRPLPEIYSGYSDAALEESGFFDALSDGGMTAAVRCLGIYGEKECTDEIKMFAEKIGGGYREEQSGLCEYTKNRLSAMLEKRRSTAHGKEKLYRTIPLLLALSVILMFI